MLSELTSMFSDSVKDELGDKLKETIGIDSDKAGDVVKVGTETIFDGFKDELLSGNISGLTDLVKGGAQGMANNVMAEGITGKVASALSEKVGLSQQMSGKAVGLILPLVMSMLNKKDGDASSFSIGGMFDMLSGNKSDAVTGGLISGLSKGIRSLFK